MQQESLPVPLTGTHPRPPPAHSPISVAWKWSRPACKEWGSWTLLCRPSRGSHCMQRCNVWRAWHFPCLKLVHVRWMTLEIWDKASEGLRANWWVSKHIFSRHLLISVWLHPIYDLFGSNPSQAKLQPGLEKNLHNLVGVSTTIPFFQGGGLFLHSTVVGGDPSTTQRGREKDGKKCLPFFSVTGPGTNQNLVRGMIKAGWGGSRGGVKRG